VSVINIINVPTDGLVIYTYW